MPLVGVESLGLLVSFLILVGLCAHVTQVLSTLARVVCGIYIVMASDEIRNFVGPNVGGPVDVVDRQVEGVFHGKLVGPHL